MYKEEIHYGGRRVTSVFHPAVPAKKCPRITGSETRHGQLLYIDEDGGRHVAETFNRVWGTRDSKAILPKGKQQFQRIRKM